MFVSLIVLMFVIVIVFVNTLAGSYRRLSTRNLDKKSSFQLSMNLSRSARGWGANSRFSGVSLHDEQESEPSVHHQNNRHPHGDGDDGDGGGAVSL